jgi:hypothetical protein
MKRALLMLLLTATPAFADMTKEQMVKLLAEMDERQNTTGDYKALTYLEQTEKDHPDIVRELIIFRRDSDDKLMMLFTKPKSEEGKGYLRLEKNLWSYDPSVGKWERTTEREKIGGTNSRRSDFDKARLAVEFDPELKSDTEKLGQYDVVHMKLTVKPNIDVAYPILELWVDKATHNLLKRQEFALSGKLARTAYYPKWNRLFSESKGAELWFPAEIRIFDEIEKINKTMIVFKSVDLHPLEQNLFTKAWLESKSR